MFVRLSAENAEKLVAAFRDFGFDVPELTPALFLEPGKIVRIGVPPLRLEVMNEISGVTFDDCFGKRVEETIDGLRMVFIDRESLLANKRAAGRPKDLADIEALTPTAKKKPPMKLRPNRGTGPTVDAGRRPFPRMPLGAVLERFQGILFPAEQRLHLRRPDPKRVVRRGTGILPVL
ncbi:MAG: hypothetical protein HY736_21210 [Verrucomicrobia bacterium]|nr:hypothetical protein [Verrucomicrobiota bacterium]